MATVQEVWYPYGVNQGGQTIEIKAFSVFDDEGALVARFFPEQGLQQEAQDRADEFAANYEAPEDDEPNYITRIQNNNGGGNGNGNNP